VIKLEAHHCKNGVTYTVTFEGPNAEQMAIDYATARRSTHAISELIIFDQVWECCPYGGDSGRLIDVPAQDQPHLIDSELYPALWAYLNPICHHGLSEHLCMDPIGEHHFGTREWAMAQGW
jgi:hypothetical protein